MTRTQSIAALVRQCRNLEQRFRRLGLDVHASTANTYARDLLSGKIWQQSDRLERFRVWISVLEREAEAREMGRVA